MQKSKTSSRREDGAEDMAQQVKILVATLDRPHYGRKSTPANCLLDFYVCCGTCVPIHTKQTNVIKHKNRKAECLKGDSEAGHGNTPPLISA